MYELFMLEPELVSAFGRSERLKLHNIGRINTASHDAPEYTHGVMYITPERLKERGRVWVFVPIPEELGDEALISLAPHCIEMAEEKLDQILMTR